MQDSTRKVPFFGARRFASSLLNENDVLRQERDQAQRKLAELGALSLLEIEKRIAEARKDLAQVRDDVLAQRQTLDAIKAKIVATEDLQILQEVGIYKYSHPLSEAVAYQSRIDRIDQAIKEMNKKEGGAIHAATDWKVNGSVAEGRRMVRDFSKLMLRAFNAEADSLVRQLKPFKVQASIERLQKVAMTIEKLGATMHIYITRAYLMLRIEELQLTADFLQKQAEEKENERAERERLREERKAQQELEREKARLEKERQHYGNALSALVAAGNEEAAARMRAQLAEVEGAMQEVELRAANIRAGYVYVISNIGSFGESLVKVGMTRRLDPMDRIRELSDASVPFNFDVHALFFSNDAVGIEAAMHSRLSDNRVNLVNLRREFFRATPLEAKLHLSQLAGDLLSFQDVAEAIEYRQSLEKSGRTQDAGIHDESYATPNFAS
jgi:hypothetical protein